MASSDPYSVEGARVMKVTKKAMLIEYEGAEVWVPKSVLGNGNTVSKEGDEGRLVVQTWYANKSGLA